MGNFARAILSVEDLSTIMSNARSGINAVHGITERGDLGKSTLCRTWEEYTRYFGGLMPPATSLFPYYCKRILDAGGLVRVSRAAHYTNPASIATTTSVKATAVNAGLTNFAGKVIHFVVATKEVVIAGDFTDFIFASDNVSIELPDGGGSFADVVVSVTLQGGNTKLVLTSFTAPNITLNSNIEWSITFAGNLSLAAKQYGDFANSKLWFKISDPKSGLANKVDISLGLDGYPELDDYIADVSTTITLSAALLLLTNGNRWATFLSNSIALEPTPKMYFTGGVYDTTLINATDIIGDITAKTGIHSFDEADDFIRISVPEYTQNSIDNALVDYCEQRNDCMPFLRVPVGLTASASIDYRKAQGIYSGGVVIDTPACAMLMSDIDVLEEYSEQRMFITTLPDALACATKKDVRIGAWGSFAGFQDEAGAGVIPNNFGVATNLGVPARILDAQAVCEAGLIPVIQKQSPLFGNATVVWGNANMQLAQNTLRRYLHVEELIVYLKRFSKPLVEAKLFMPNDTVSWKNLYAAFKLFLRDLQTNRAIDTFEYIGDQNADSISQATYNQLADIQAGKYKFKIKFVPVILMEEITLTFTVQNSIVTVTI